MSLAIAGPMIAANDSQRKGVGKPDNQVTESQCAIGISGSAIPVSVSGAAMVMVQLDCLDNWSSLH